MLLLTISSGACPVTVEEIMPFVNPASESLIVCAMPVVLEGPLVGALVGALEAAWLLLVFVLLVLKTDTLPANFDMMSAMLFVVVELAPLKKPCAARPVTFDNKYRHVVSCWTSVSCEGSNTAASELVSVSIRWKSGSCTSMAARSALHIILRLSALAASCSGINEQSEPPVEFQQEQLAVQYGSVTRQSLRTLPEMSLYTQSPLPLQSNSGMALGQLWDGTRQLPDGTSQRK
jgi:hypothetical protein